MSRRRSGWLAAGVSLITSGLLAVPAFGAGPSLLIAAARLQGAYNLGGVVTQAVGIPGERPGQQVTRIWNFASPCPAGPCSVLGLSRHRGAGVDSLFLHEVTPGSYAGAGSFYAPVRCGRHYYRRGTLVPFKVTVTITTAALQPDGSVLATGFGASYRNTMRIGRTPCFSVPSYDSARYIGTPVPPPAAGASRRVRSIPSSSGS